MITVQTELILRHGAVQAAGVLHILQVTTQLQVFADTNAIQLTPGKAAAA